MIQFRMIRLLITTPTLLSLFILFFFPSSLSAQMGCTDMQALNFDASATSNDGSCIYPATNYTMTNIANLPSALQESSGLALTSAGLWTHNDGGNSDEIFLIDSMTGAILQTVLVANAENEDWEDLAEDDDYLYIGDFGNNGGDRMDLRVFRVAKSSLGNLIVNAEVIEFGYSDQIDFTTLPNNNNYDCEAFFYQNDSLHLFTKNWANNQTRHYTLAATPGSHTAYLRGSFDSQGLITGADVNENGVAALIGYTGSGLNFMWLLFDYPSHQLLSGNKRKINLGTGLTNSQTEGIVFKDKYAGYVSSENFNILPPRLLRFSIEEWIEETVSTETLLADDAFSFKVYPNPVQNHLTIQSNKNLTGAYQLSLFDQKGDLILQKDWQAIGDQMHTWDLAKAALPNGSYFLRIEKGIQLYFQQVIKIGE